MMTNDREVMVHKQKPSNWVLVFSIIGLIMTLVMVNELLTELSIVYKINLPIVWNGPMGFTGGFVTQETLVKVVIALFANFFGCLIGFIHVLRDRGNINPRMHVAFCAVCSLCVGYNFYYLVFSGYSHILFNIAGCLVISAVFFLFLKPNWLPTQKNSPGEVS